MKVDLLLKTIERILITVVSVSFCYVVYYLSVHKEAEISLLPLEGVHAQGNITTEAYLPEFKPYEFYSQQINAKNFFFLTEQSGSADAANATTGGAFGQYKVVGILVGKPSEVIIEGVQDKKTFSIEEGATQSGIDVKSVSEDRVVLNYQGGEIVIKFRENNATF